LRRAANASEKQSNYTAFLQQFVDFVRREDPKVLSTIEALLATGTQGEASDQPGITETEFGRKRTRLSQLAKCFVSGERVPRQRRPYKRRVVKSKAFQATCT